MILNHCFRIGTLGVN